jgi:hypothetical protein
MATRDQVDRFVTQLQDEILRIGQDAKLQAAEAMDLTLRYAVELHAQYLGVEATATRLMEASERGSGDLLGELGRSVIAIAQRLTLVRLPDLTADHDPETTKEFIRRVHDAVVQICRDNPEFDNARMWGVVVWFFSRQFADTFGEAEAQKLLYYIAETGFEAAEQELIGPRH